MNTVQHTTMIRTVHEIRMEGPITARDIGDFIHQVHDYYVTGDEGGITATFETKEAKPR